ncbi:MAG: type I CRISPR-associated protein Cas7, partial [Verrucomicrobiae bacterium]|nr:type I CRISPR-associated protein Cas7 [Verrucomicrobiae bacterium]
VYKRQALLLAACTLGSAAWAKLPPPSDEAKAKAAEAAGPEAGESDKPAEEESDEKEEVSPAKQAKQRAFQIAVLRTFFDLRAFGGVLSTEGPLKGSFYGQIRGPLQFTFSESLDKVLPLDATITRCAVASVDEAKKQEQADSGDNRTMGRKFGIDYGLYRGHIHFSPAFAAKTGFTYYDLDNFLFALTKMFGWNNDNSSLRTGMRVVGLVDFQHQSALGNAPAHKLFDLVKVRGIKIHLGNDGKPSDPQPPREEEGRDAFNGKWVFKSSGSEFPRSLDDYEGEAPEAELHVTKSGEIKPGKNSEGVAVIQARRIVWEIPPKQADAKTS